MTYAENKLTLFGGYTLWLPSRGLHYRLLLFYNLVNRSTKETMFQVLPIIKPIAIPIKSHLIFVAFIAFFISAEFSIKV